MRKSDFKQNNSSELKKVGYLVINNFFTNQQCEEILALIASYQEKYKLTEIYRANKERSLRYFVINGEQIEKHFPRVWELYEEINQLVNQVSDQPLVPISNKLPAVNIAILKSGGEYRWHYDRNSVTALLYLNLVDGGELELFPNYRIGGKKQKFTFLQRCLDEIIKHKLIRNFFSKKVSIKPSPGLMVIMKGDRCLHSVKAVEGEKERINIVMSYDLPGMQFPVTKGLDSYLYTKEKQSSSDPNYV
jgi:hypothetical protein